MTKKREEEKKKSTFSYWQLPGSEFVFTAGAHKSHEHGCVQ